MCGISHWISWIIILIMCSFMDRFVCNISHALLEVEVKVNIYDTYHDML